MATVGQLRGRDICDQGGGIGEWAAWDLEYGNESWLTIRVVFTASGVHYQQLGGLWHQIRSVRFYLPAGPELVHPPLFNLATDLCDILDATEAPAKKNLRVAGHRRCFIQPQPRQHASYLSIADLVPDTPYKIHGEPGGPDGMNTIHFAGHLEFRVGSIALLLFSQCVRHSITRNKEKRAVGPLEVLS